MSHSWIHPPQILQTSTSTAGDSEIANGTSRETWAFESSLNAACPEKREDHGPSIDGKKPYKYLVNMIIKKSGKIWQIWWSSIDCHLVNMMKYG